MNNVSIIIPIHSFVDLITNSSSEIYIYASESTIKAVKGLINNLLSGVGSDKTADDLFTFDIGTEVDNPIPYKDRKPGDPYSLVVSTTSLEGATALEEWCGDYPKETSLVVTAKAGTPESIKLAAETLSHLTGLFSMEGCYNG